MNSTKKLLNQHRSYLTVIKRSCHNEKKNTSFIEWCHNEVKSMKRKGTYREPPHTALQRVEPPYVKLANYPRKMLDFSTCDFLNLAYNPHVLVAYNVGLTKTSSLNTKRSQQGVTRWSLELDEVINTHLGTESCLTCANLQDNMRALWNSNPLKDAVVLHDEYTSFPLPSNHKLISFRHQHFEELEKKIQSIGEVQKVIVTDRTFPETGEITDFSELNRIARSQNSLLFVNTSYDWNTSSNPQTVSDDADLIYCDISKQIGQLKCGYIAGRSYLTDQIIHSKIITDVSGAVASAVAWIMQTLSDKEVVVKQLKQNGLALRRQLREVGFQIRGHNAPIIAIHTRTHNDAKELVTGLKNDGILCKHSGPEFQHEEGANVQVNLTINHKPQHLDSLVKSATSVGKRYKILK